MLRRFEFTGHQETASASFPVVPAYVLRYGPRECTAMSTPPRLTSIELRTSDLATTRDFYSRLLQLPATPISLDGAAAVVFQLPGDLQLCIREDPAAGTGRDGAAVTLHLRQADGSPSRSRPDPAGNQARLEAGPAGGQPGVTP
jgi:catechol 2,3-dioxygenase-like lactoylglutathione lyase family enzyme